MQAYELNQSAFAHFALFAAELFFKLIFLPLKTQRAQTCDVGCAVRTEEDHSTED